MKPGYILCAECGQEHGVWVECEPLLSPPALPPNAKEAGRDSNGPVRHASSDGEAVLERQIEQLQAELGLAHSFISDARWETYKERRAALRMASCGENATPDGATS
jgi:hypothetical protein